MRVSTFASGSVQKSPDRAGTGVLLDSRYVGWDGIWDKGWDETIWDGNVWDDMGWDMGYGMG